MGRPRVFIDGQAGTIGLRLRSLLGDRPDLELLEIDPRFRKDSAARAELLNGADVSILCLPDAAAREAVAAIANPNARVIDGSTAHRVEPGWVYGVPELCQGQRAAIASAARVSNPGCYPTCVSLLLRPLVDADLLAPDAPLAIHALSGYSGGGQSMLDHGRAPSWTGYPALRSALRARPSPQARPQMMRHGRLSREPLFVPAVGPFRCGMRVQIPLPAGVASKGATAATVFDGPARALCRRAVREGAAARASGDGAERLLDPTACNDTNRVELSVLPHPSGHLLLVAILDNLGKGASGAAVQNLNLMLGLDEFTGLA